MSHGGTPSRIRDIAIVDIDRSRNHRIPRPGDAERLEALKQSIQACGQLLQPIRVYERSKDQKDKKHPEPYILGFGARRCQAMEMLGRPTILAVVFPPATDAEIAQARAIENVNRQDITPMEEVLAVSDMLEAIKAEAAFTGDPYEEAAARLGCEVSWVKDRDYLHRLTKPVQQFALRTGLPAGHLRELAKVGDPLEQMRLACEAAGAPPHAFPADPKKAKAAEWQQQLQDGYFAELADGKAQRWPLSRLKDQVARVQLSLRLIPWEFDKPVKFGATELRKCTGCPHNSETDRTLFGIDEDTANPNGYCLNSSCYGAKHEAAEAAKARVLEKVTIRKDHAPETIRKMSPDWLKESTVVGYVKRQLEKASSAAEAASSATPKTTSAGRPLTDHELALRKFAEAFDVWEQKAFVAVLKGINADPAYRVSWCVLLGVPAFWDHSRVQLPRMQIHSMEPTVAEPVIPPLPEELEQAIGLAFKGTRNAWIEALGKHEQCSPDQRGGLGIPHPRVLELLAEAVQVKLPATPQWKFTAKPVEAPVKETHSIVKESA